MSWTPALLVLLLASAASAAPFEPVDLTVDVSALPESEQRALGKMIEAARLMDTLFLRQAWAGNEPMLLALLVAHRVLNADARGALGIVEGAVERMRGKGLVEGGAGAA